MSADNYIVTDIVDGICTIRFNRADKKNAITADMYGQMADNLKSAFADENVRCVLFLGMPGVFTAGNDIADFMQVAMSGERSSMAVFDFLENIIMAPKPMVAGVDGLAIGVGTTMLFHCDLVFASTQASFKAPFVDLGLVPEAGSSLIIPEVVGYHNAFAILAAGQSFDAPAAHNAGFVNEVVDPQELEAKARQAAQMLASKPVEAMKLTRDLVRGDRTPVLERMREEAEIFGQRLVSDEARQAFMAFMSKG